MARRRITPKLAAGTFLLLWTFAFLLVNMTALSRMYTSHNEPQQNMRIEKSSSNVQLDQHISPADKVKAVKTPDYVQVSVCIPASSDRLKNVENALRSIARGTRLPAEVIISVSSVPLNSTVSIEFPPELNVIFVRSPKKQNAAENRNVAASHASTPILSFLDSDDIAGPRWIETVAHVFNSFPVEAFLNKFFSCKNEGTGPPTSLPQWADLMDMNEIFPTGISEQMAYQWSCCPTKLPVLDQGKHNRLFDEEYSHPWVQHAHISVLRAVWESVKQREGKSEERKEDSWFVADVLRANYKTVASKEKLTGYCKH
jgi:glycosyltransferase involved in cell wall biosynthesis